MNYMTLKEASEKWGVSPCMINYYCAARRIAGSEKKEQSGLCLKAQKNRWTEEKRLLHKEKMNMIDVYYILCEGVGYHETFSG